jgi:hypothetical protein
LHNQEYAISSFYALYSFNVFISASAQEIMNLLVHAVFLSVHQTNELDLILFLNVLKNAKLSKNSAKGLEIIGCYIGKLNFVGNHMLECFERVSKTLLQ